MSSSSLVIVGGGLSGLAAALFAQDEGLFERITVLEGSGELGGVIRSHVSSAFLLEEGAESISRARPAAAALCARLGIQMAEANISPAATQMVIEGRLISLPSGFELMASSSYWPLVASPLLRWADRWGEEPAAGNGVNGDKIAAEVAARLSRLFLTPVGGMGAIIEALVKELDGVDIRTDTPVSRIERRDGAWSVAAAGIEPARADAVILAVPVPAAAVLTVGVDPGLAAELGAVRSHSVVSVNLAWKRDDVPESVRDCAGFLVPEREGRLVSYCAFSSNNWPGRSDAGHVLLRVLARGGGELLSLDDEELFLRVWLELQEILGIDQPPRLRHIVRHPWALPDFDVEHGARLGRVDDRLFRLTGLGIAGSLWRGPGTSNVVEAAGRALKKVTADCRLEVEDPALSP